MGTELVVREATANDLEDLAFISRTTWDGDDYLEGISATWLRQGGFYVGEIDGRVVACGKISPFPGRVAWLEGLRVHADFRGRGFGRTLSDAVLGIVLEKVNAGEFLSVEFATYINNRESVTMSEKQGFKTTEFFRVVSMDNPPVQQKPVALKRVLPSQDDFVHYPLHAPCGWKFIYPHKTDSIDWMKKNATFWEVETGARFLAANRGSEISPLASSFDDWEGFMRGVFAFAERKRLDYLEIIAHETHGETTEAATVHGFSYWDEHGKPNIPIYKYLP